jgi:hypothetical protein
MPKETSQWQKLINKHGPYKNAYSSILCDIPALKIDALYSGYGIRNVARPRGSYEIVITNNVEDEAYSNKYVLLFGKSTEIGIVIEQGEDYIFYEVPKNFVESSL